MELKEIIKNRRSYRSIEPVEITEELIKELAEATQLAMSCFNNQPWRFVFVYDKEKHEEMNGALSSGNKWAHHGSMYIVVFSKPDLDCQIKGRDYYLFDTGMGFAFMILRAADMGLVIHPMAGFNEEKVKEILNIPDEMKVITVAALGKKTEEIGDFLSDKQLGWEKERPERMPIDKIVFRNSYEPG